MSGFPLPRPRRFLIPFAAAAVALLAWWSFSTTRPANDPAPEPEPGETIEVLIAAHEMSRGTYLRDVHVDKLVAKVKRPKASVPADFVGDVAQLTGTLVLHDVKPGWVFRRGDTGEWHSLAWPGGEPDLYSLPVDSDACGDLLPGTRADWMAVKWMGPTLLIVPLWKDMPIFDVEPGGKTAGPRRPQQSVVTVPVDQEQTLVGSLAQKAGFKVWVIPRNRSDVGFNEQYSVQRTNELLSRYRRSGAERAPPPRARFTDE